MSRFGDDPDVEMTGCLASNGSAKAYHFQPDFGSDEALWIPRSQADWLPEIGDDEKRGTMKVRAWLARKNEWS